MTDQAQPRDIATVITDMQREFAAFDVSVSPRAACRAVLRALLTPAEHAAVEGCGEPDERRPEDWREVGAAVGGILRNAGFVAPELLWHKVVGEVANLILQPAELQAIEASR